MKGNSTNFTETALHSLQPKAQRFYVYDNRQANLCLMVTPQGHKAFYIRKTHEGRPVRFCLGRWPDLSVEGARKKAAAFLGRLATGDSLSVARTDKKSGLTFGEFFELEFLEKHAKVHKKSWKYDQEQFTRHLKVTLGPLDLLRIDRNAIESLFRKITEESGKSTANHILALISVIFSKAQAWGRFPEDRTIPTKFIKKHKERSRDRFLMEEEMPRFMAALEEEPNEAFRDFVKLALHTAARKANTLQMRWSELNLTEGLWHIPETKNGEALTIPLTPPAVEILLRRRKQGLSSLYVFPGDGEGGWFKDPKRAWARLLQRAQIEDLTMHDLRRTVGSHMVMNGVSPFVVGKALGHKSLKATMVYAHADKTAIRQALNIMAQKLTPPQKETTDAA